jgi:Rrf2 family transcriptional regulator, iron-sulfur cluster assembly transcription factor
VADIVLAVDEPAQPGTRAADQTSGDGNPPCQRIASDWCADLERAMSQFLTSVSLQNLVSEQYRLGAAPEPVPARGRSQGRHGDAPQAGLCRHATR